MEARIKITTTNYFPISAMIFGGCLFFLGLGLILDFRPWGWSGLLLVWASFIIFTTRYQLSINLVEQTYHDYLWISGFRKGQKQSFQAITGMYINENPYSQAVNSRASTMTKHGIEYNGYIRFDEEDIHLLSDDSKDKVIRKMKKIQEALRGNIVSSTSIQIDSEITDYCKNES